MSSGSNAPRLARQAEYPGRNTLAACKVHLYLRRAYCGIELLCCLSPHALKYFDFVTIQSLRPKPIADHEPMFMTQFLTTRIVTTARDTKANGYEPRKMCFYVSQPLIALQTSTTANSESVFVCFYLVM
jgi:hypothetical protein